MTAEHLEDKCVLLVEVRYSKEVPDAEHLEDKCVLLVEVRCSKEVPDADAEAAAAESAAAAEL